MKKTNFFFLLLAAAAFFSLLFLLQGGNKTVPNLSCVASPDVISLLGNPTDEKLAVFEGQKILVAKLKNVPFQKERKFAKVLGDTSGERWIELDLSEQKLKAWEGSNLFLETAVSTGLPWTPTPTGEFKIELKNRAQKMEGGQGKYYYYLPNVPYVMFFGNDQIPWYKGFSLHGTYWHNDFGTRRSHGCVNLPTPIAEQLYYWTQPFFPDTNSMRASSESPGTRVVIHE